MQPTLCIMSFCLHGLKRALWCNLCRASPALLCALQLTDNICTASWLFREWKHTSSRDPACLVGLLYRGGRREKLKKQGKSVKQATDEHSGESDSRTGLHRAFCSCRPAGPPIPPQSSLMSKLLEFDHHITLSFTSNPSYTISSQELALNVWRSCIWTDVCLPIFYLTFNERECACIVSPNDYMRRCCWLHSDLSCGA